jgi:hypothetical protein
LPLPACRIATFLQFDLCTFQFAFWHSALQYLARLHPAQILLARALHPPLEHKLSGNSSLLATDFE